MILTVCPNPSVDSFANISGLLAGKSNRIQQIREYPGGKGVHVAMALRELGAKVKLMGFWAGPAGSWIKNACQNQSIPVSGVELEGNTRRCYTFLATDPNWDHTELLEPGPELSTEKFGLFKEQFKSALQGVAMVCIAGSWPKGSPDDACAQLVQLAHEAEVKVVLDCTGIQLTHALSASVHGLHLNEDEYKAFLLAEGSQALDQVGFLALTKGKEGLKLKNGSHSVNAKLALKKIISTVGSGDCLTAGICHALSLGLSLEEMARWGVACGAANCLREELGMIYKNDVNRLLGLVEINENSTSKFYCHGSKKQT